MLLASKPAIKTKNNFKVGFLGWNLLAKSNSAKILTTIRQAKKNVDLLVVSFHWGQEYTSFPSQSQRKLAHQAIEAGAEDTYWHNNLLDVYTKVEDLEKVKKNLEEKGYKIDSSSLDQKIYL